MSEGGQFTPADGCKLQRASFWDNPVIIGAEQLTGVLNLRELDYYGYGNLENETVGTKGYIIYDWSGFIRTSRMFVALLASRRMLAGSILIIWSGNTRWTTPLEPMKA